MSLLNCCLLLIFIPGPGPVQDLSVVSINETTFYISFTTPTNPNGLIKEYQINVGNTLDTPANFTNTINHTEGVDGYFTYATRLREHNTLLMLVVHSYQHKQEM